MGFFARENSCALFFPFPALPSMASTAKTANAHLSNSKHDVRLSKMLSKLLRHDPKDLTLQPDGFAKVKQILNLTAFRKYNAADIVRVVEGNAKQRFSLQGSGGKLLIRANQGHSIKTIDQEQLLTRVHDPSEIPVCVHGTYLKAWPVIQATGLDKMKRNHVHMAVGAPESGHVVSGMRNSCQIIIHIDVQKAMEDGMIFYKSSNGVVLTEGVILPCYFLKVILRKDGTDLMVHSLATCIGETKTSNRFDSTQRH